MAKCVCSVAAAGYQQARHNLEMSLDSFSVLAGIWAIRSSNRTTDQAPTQVRAVWGALPPGALLVCVLGAVILNPACPTRMAAPCYREPSQKIQASVLGGRFSRNDRLISQSPTQDTESAMLVDVS